MGRGNKRISRQEMKTTKLISILTNLPLKKVERDLLEVNTKLINSNFLCVKKCGVDGVRRLGTMVNFRIWLER
jgi:hypothetical protein